MKQLLCWTLAALYNIASFNRPTQADVARFSLEGWDSPGWFEGNSRNWANWVDATWGQDLKSHLNDSFVSGDPTGPLALGGAQGWTFNFQLYKALAKNYTKPGNFLEDVVGDYCSEIYPPTPVPTPSPTPEPVWTELSASNFYMDMGSYYGGNYAKPEVVVVELPNGTWYWDWEFPLLPFGGESYTSEVFRVRIIDGSLYGFIILNSHYNISQVQQGVSREDSTLVTKLYLSIRGYRLPVTFNLYSWEKEDFSGRFILPENFEEADWVLKASGTRCTLSTKLQDTGLVKGVWVRNINDYTLGSYIFVVASYDESYVATTDVSFNFGGQDYRIKMLAEVVNNTNNESVTWGTVHRLGGGQLCDPYVSSYAQQGPDRLQIKYIKYVSWHEFLDPFDLWVWFDLSEVSEDFELPEGLAQASSSMKFTRPEQNGRFDAGGGGIASGVLEYITDSRPPTFSIIGGIPLVYKGAD